MPLAPLSHPFTPRRTGSGRRVGSPRSWRVSWMRSWAGWRPASRRSCSPGSTHCRPKCRRAGAPRSLQLQLPDHSLFLTPRSSSGSLTTRLPRPSALTTPLSLHLVPMLPPLSPETSFRTRNVTNRPRVSARTPAHDNSRATRHV